MSPCLVTRRGRTSSGPRYRLPAQQTPGRTRTDDLTGLAMRSIRLSYGGLLFCAVLMQPEGWGLYGREGMTANNPLSSRMAIRLPESKKAGTRTRLRPCYFGSYITPLICASAWQHGARPIPCEATTFAVRA